MTIYAENVNTEEAVRLTGIGSADVRVGEVFTVEGVRTAVLNTNRAWWQFWRPRWIIGPLQRYRVTSVDDHG